MAVMVVEGFLTPQKSLRYGALGGSKSKTLKREHFKTSYDVQFDKYLR